MLELAISTVSGRPALGIFEVPLAAGPVIVVLEESGRAALHRRLPALMRGGRHIEAQPRSRSCTSANQRVRLDADEWQQQPCWGMRDRAAGDLPRPARQAQGAHALTRTSRPIWRSCSNFRLATRQDRRVNLVRPPRRPHRPRTHAWDVRPRASGSPGWQSRLRAGQATFKVTADHREAEGGTTLTYRSCLRDRDPARGRRRAAARRHRAGRAYDEELIIAHVREHPQQDTSKAALEASRTQGSADGMQSPRPRRTAACSGSDAPGLIARDDPPAVPRSRRSRTPGPLRPAVPPFKGGPRRRRDNVGTGRRGSPPGALASPRMRSWNFSASGW